MKAYVVVESLRNEDGKRVIIPASELVFFSNPKEAVDQANIKSSLDPTTYYGVAVVTLEDSLIKNPIAKKLDTDQKVSIEHLSLVLEHHALNDEDQIDALKMLNAIERITQAKDSVFKIMDQISHMISLDDVISPILHFVHSEAESEESSTQIMRLPGLLERYRIPAEGLLAHHINITVQRDDDNKVTELSYDRPLDSESVELKTTVYRSLPDLYRINFTPKKQGDSSGYSTERDPLLEIITKKINRLTDAVDFQLIKSFNNLLLHYQAMRGTYESAYGAESSWKKQLDSGEYREALTDAIKTTESVFQLSYASFYKQLIETKLSLKTKIMEPIFSELDSASRDSASPLRTRVDSDTSDAYTGDDEAMDRSIMSTATSVSFTSSLEGDRDASSYNNETPFFKGLLEMTVVKEGEDPLALLVGL
jgi:hypothetical protein